MDEAIRDAVASAMRKLQLHRKLSETEFEKELEWQIRHVRLSSKNRIIWPSFKVGQRLMKKIIKSQRGRCYHCEGFLDLKFDARKTNSPTFEHLKPLSKGGLDHPDNLVIACYNCNQLKGSKDVDEFNRPIAVIRPPTT